MSVAELEMSAKKNNISEEAYMITHEKLIEAVYGGEYLPNIDGYTYYIAVEEATGEIVCGDLCGQNWWSKWHDGYMEIGKVTAIGYGDTEDDKEAYYSQLTLYAYDDNPNKNECRNIISFDGKYFEEW